MIFHHRINFNQNLCVLLTLFTFLLRARSLLGKGARDNEEEIEKAMIFLQYREKLTEKFEHTLKMIEAPCKVIITKTENCHFISEIGNRKSS